MWQGNKLLITLQPLLSGLSYSSQTNILVDTCSKNLPFHQMNKKILAGSDLLKTSKQISSWHLPCTNRCAGISETLLKRVESTVPATAELML